MQSCVQVFEDVVDAKFAAAGGSITLDINKTLINLTTVSFLYQKGYFPREETTDAWYILGCDECDLLWRLAQPGPLK
jgi:hypothetical protein